MAGVNRVILIGNLGRDPEIRNLEGGVKKASFSLATTETYKGKSGERIDQTEWHNVVLWRGLADVADSYLKKGSTIYLEGKIKSREYTDKDGNRRFITEIIGDNMVMLSSKRDQQAGAENNGAARTEKAAQTEPADQHAEVTPEQPEDDLPF
jgi:single-strand DNA-binding protein